MNKTLREKKIVELKTKLIEQHFYIISFVFICYSFYFTFVMKSLFMTWYILGALISTNAMWFFLRNRVSVEFILKCYLIVAPLYCFTIIVIFWDYTATNCVWLMSLVVGAYIYFGKKGLRFYGTYALLIMIMVPVVANNVKLYTITASDIQTRISDMFLFASNIVIITHALYYKEKILSLQLITKIEKREKIELPVTLDSKEVMQHENLFERIEDLMVVKQSFKDPDFNVSLLSSKLKVSVSYVSRAIRYKEFPNFNSYINSHRIKYVVTLLQEEDLDKVTLLYIYTEAGYKNQSTFNTAFKKIIGVTPSEYIQSYKESMSEEGMNEKKD